MDLSRLNEIISCGICFESYNEDNRRPRMLLCGHTFCTACLEKILVQSPSCPTCMTEIKFKLAGRIPVNFAVKGMISEVKQDNTGLSQKSLPVVDQNSLSPVVAQNSLPPVVASSSLQVTTTSSSNGKLNSVGYCSEHSNFRELRCKDCEIWICAMCCCLNHRQCQTLLVKEAYKELRELESMIVESELATKKDIIQDLTESLMQLHQDRKVLIDEIKRKKKELGQKEILIEEQENKKAETSKCCEKLENLKKNFDSSSNDSEFSKSKSELDDLLGRQWKGIDNSQTVERPFPRSFKLENLIVLCERQPVCVVEYGNEFLYGMVKSKDGQIWISSFQAERPNALLLSFREFLSRLKGFYKFPKRAFLKLTPEGADTEIDAVIDTDETSLRAKNFILLCASLRGQTYKGSTLSYDSFHDDSPFYGLKPGPPPVVEGISGKVPRTPCKEADLFGMRAGNSYFFISLGFGSDRLIHYPKIGVVVSGIQQLKELNGRNLTVKDCGMIV